MKSYADDHTLAKAQETKQFIRTTNSHKKADSADELPTTDSVPVQAEAAEKVSSPTTGSDSDDKASADEKLDGDTSDGMLN